MSIKLIDAIFNTLDADATFMAFFGLTPASPMTDKVDRIVKGMEPDKALNGGNIPKMFIYTKPGRFGRNPLVFEGKFCLDFYAKSSIVAKQMAERAFVLFHDHRINDTTFHSYLCVLAHESDFGTGITGVKGYEAIYDVDFLRTN